MTQPTQPSLHVRFRSLTGLLSMVSFLLIAGCSGRPNAERGDQAFSLSLASVSQVFLDRIAGENAPPAAEPVIGQWPPSVGAVYPELQLMDQNREPFQLSSLAGKVILLELAAIPCQGCQAFAGGSKRGGYGNVPVQPGLDSIHDYAKRFGQVDLDHDADVVFVQLLLYGKSMSSPTQREVTGWANHFGMDRSHNQIVLRGNPSMVSRATYDMIPGFHLIDRQFVLRYDSSGHQPKDDLYRDLLPALGQMARQR